MLTNLQTEVRKVKVVEYIQKQVRYEDGAKEEYESHGKSREMMTECVK